MANDIALIPCEVCGNLFTIDEYMTHTATHQTAMMDYSQGNMYGPVTPEMGGQGPMPKPSGYKDPHPESVVTNADYVADDYDYNMGDMYGGKKTTDTKNDKDDDEKGNDMDDEKKNEIQDITEKSANAIRDDGCCIISNGIRKDLVKNALRLINNALSKGPDVLSTDEYTKNYDILDLFNESAAFSLCQNVLGLANVVIPKIAEIKLVFPEKEELDEKDMENIDLNWTIDGLEGGKDDDLAGYSLGMRMALSKQKFKYYKGTHQAVFDMMKTDGMDKFIELNKDSKKRKEFDKEKHKLVELEVNKGDIVLYHPFLCLPLDDLNYTEDIDYYVNFRVNHKNFNPQIGAKRAEHLWLGYEQLKDALPSEVLKI